MEEVVEVQGVVFRSVDPLENSYFELLTQMIHAEMAQMNYLMRERLDETGLLENLMDSGLLVLHF